MNPNVVSPSVLAAILPWRTSMMNHQQVVVLHVDCHVIRTKPDHPFFTDKGWVNAGDLRVGDLPRTHDGSWATVQASRSKNSPSTSLSPASCRTRRVGYYPPVC